MKRSTSVGVLVLVSLALALRAAYAVPMGFISWDVTSRGSTGQFDISNQTGPNSSPFPDPTWPVSTSVNLSSLSLKVDFTSGPSTVFGSSYFTLAPDGLSFDGSTIPIGGANPLPTDATLTGAFSPTAITLNDGSTLTILPGFSATIAMNPSGLSDGDFAVIDAASAAPAPVPEPGTLALLGTGIVGLLRLRRRHLPGNVRARFSAKGRSALPFALFLFCLILIPPASWAIVSSAAVKLNVLTTPSSGVAGVTDVNLTGSGFPSGTIPPGNVTITLAPTCGGASAASATALSVKSLIGTSRRVQFQLPGSLAQGNYFVAMSGTTSGGASFHSSNCSEVDVEHTNAALAACIPTSSLGVLAPATGPAAVTAYVPNGCWACGTSGVQVVPLEPTPVGVPTSIATAGVVNSCSSNPATGQTVCVANDTDVYLITGTTLNTTLNSGSNAFASFSGGSCENCGVAINALSNQAILAMGLTPSLSGTGLQFLDLGTNTFATPIQAANHVSEDISIDPTRGFILSPNESSVYDLFQTSPTSVAEFGNSVSPGQIFDSAAEDCTTGIALASSEFSSNVYIADLTQATFIPGSPGTWTAPQQIQTLNASFSAGTSGISVAPGSSHLGIVTGEFGGSSFAVLQLPSTSGSGTPGIVDYAVAFMPSIPGFGGFSAGLDPHTVTAYTSPNDGKAYAVMANLPPPSFLGVIDLAALLAAPRVDDFLSTPCSPGPTCHTVDPTFDLLTSSIVRYVSTH